MMKILMTIKKMPAKWEQGTLLLLFMKLFRLDAEDDSPSVDPLKYQDSKSGFREILQ